MLTGTKVIHIAERDTQITDVPKAGRRVRQHVVGRRLLRGRHRAGRARLGHAREAPAAQRLRAHGDGPRNQICLAQPGMETWVRSWVPAGEIRGMVVRHGEAFTISDHLTVWGDDGNPVYRPTVHYAYCPSDAAINSVLELRMRNWEMQPRQRILNDEIISGRDELGVLLMGHPYRVVVDRLAAVDRRGPGGPAAPERDHVAGRRLDHRRRHVDDREPERRRLRARRPAVARRARGRDARTSARCTRRRPTGTRCRTPQRSVPGRFGNEPTASITTTRGSSATSSSICNALTTSANRRQTECRCPTARTAAASYVGQAPRSRACPHPPPIGRGVLHFSLAHQPVSHPHSLQESHAMPPATSHPEEDAVRQVQAATSRSCCTTARGPTSSSTRRRCGAASTCATATRR